MLHEAIFLPTNNAIPLHSKSLTKIARVTSLCNWLHYTKQVAEKVEQSSTFRNVVNPVAACNMYRAAGLRTVMSQLSLTANNRVIFNYIAGKNNLHCKLQNNCSSLTSYLQLAIFSYCQHCIARYWKNCLM